MDPLLPACGHTHSHTGIVLYFFNFLVALSKLIPCSSLSLLQPGSSSTTELPWRPGLGSRRAFWEKAPDDTALIGIFRSTDTVTPKPRNARNHSSGTGTAHRMPEAEGSAEPFTNSPFHAAVHLILLLAPEFQSQSGFQRSCHLQSMSVCVCAPVFANL